MLDKNTTPTKLLWIDLEMTGLDPQKDRIVEVAVIVTDFNFKKLDEYQAVIHQSDKVIKSMNPWAASQHSASGLTAKIRSSQVTEKDAVKDVYNLIRKNFGEEQAILAGNSIYNDRNFIKQWWPKVDGLLHYRMLDVSSFKILMQAKYNVEYLKSDNHRAMGDIQASIDELSHYINKLKS